VNCLSLCLEMAVESNEQIWAWAKLELGSTFYFKIKLFQLLIM
jgi:hypothetical protein